MSLNLIDSLTALSVCHTVCAGTMTDSVSVYTDLTDASASSVLGNCGDVHPNADADCGDVYPKTPDADADADGASADESQEADPDDVALEGMPAVEVALEGMPAVEAPGSVALVRFFFFLKEAIY